MARVPISLREPRSVVALAPQAQPQLMSDESVTVNGVSEHSTPLPPRRMSSASMSRGSLLPPMTDEDKAEQTKGSLDGFRSRSSKS